jgi:hypothetical protein
VGIYGRVRYGESFYGISAIPTSVLWDVFDFCEPTEATLLTLLSYSNVSTSRYGAPVSWFSGNDYCMYSDDGVGTNVRIDIAVPFPTATLEFSILPSTLPEDFSDPVANRAFFGVYANGANAVGLLLSEDGGIALAVDPTTVLSVFPDSADIFAEGLDYYVFRVVIDGAMASLYVTRKDVLTLTGVHQLRYTFPAPECPSTVLDGAFIEVVGQAADPTLVCLDCLRLSSSALYGNEQPVAVITTPDQRQRTGSYAFMDGRESYDPDSPPQPLEHMWTLTGAPSGDASLLLVEAAAPADPSGYTNRATGAAGAFSDVLVGDLLVGPLISGVIVYVSADGSEVVSCRDVLPGGVTGLVTVVRQYAWGGERLSGTLLNVVAAGVSPPLVPEAGEPYLVLFPAVGAWAGHEGELAVYTGAWAFTTPTLGTVVFVRGDYECYRYAGAGLWRIDDPLPWELPRWEGRLRPTSSFLLSVAGIYDVDLVVTDGVRTSVPASGIVTASALDTVLGVVPDLSFLWKHLPGGFWELVEGREVFPTFWSALTQLAAGELLELWQHQMSLDLFRVQRTFQRHWLNYDLRVELTSYRDLPAALDTGLDVAGYSTAPDVVPPQEYTYALGAIVPGVEAGQYLVLAGVLYRILRVVVTTQTLVVTAHPMVTGADRPSHWMIRPTATSVLDNFSALAVAANDVAVFEIVEDGETSFVEAPVYGVRDGVVAFGGSSIAPYSGADVYLRYVRRRSTVAVDASVVSVPKLQEVINYGVVSGAAAPLYEGRDYHIADSVLSFLDVFFPVELRGYDGSTPDSHTFEDLNADFTSIGSDCLLEVNGGRYRVAVVLSATQLELEDDCLPAGLSGESWVVRSALAPPAVVWAEITHLSNHGVISSNFGRLIGFSEDMFNERTDGLDYLSAVRGLWSYVYNARTLEATRSAAQIALGLPFAEVTGVVVDIRTYGTATVVLVRDAAPPYTVRSYRFLTSLGVATNPVTGVAYTVGDEVVQFSPVCGGVAVEDYVSDPDWFSSFLGSGDFYEVQKLSYFGVQIRSTAFNAQNAGFLIEFLRRHRVRHRDAYFSVLHDVSESFNALDSTVLGPAVPAGYTFPDTWLDYDTPYGWASSPFELPRAPITGHYPTTPAVPVSITEKFGGLHVHDVLGRVPNVWSGAWPSGHYGTHLPAVTEGSFSSDSLDPRGRPIHRADLPSLAVNLLGDGTFESVDDPGMGASPWDLQGAPATAAKVALPVHEGAKSLHIVSVDGGMGVRQDVATAVLREYQVAVRLWVQVTSGQARIELVDTASGTTLATARCTSSLFGAWGLVTLHTWYGADIAFPPATRLYTLRITTGPGGGDFYVDAAALYGGVVPWSQNGPSAHFQGRTGGMNDGGLPEERVQALLCLNHPGGVPSANAFWRADAASAPDEMRIHGPAVAPLPPADWSAPGVSSTPWYGPNYGLAIETWKAATGYPGYGVAPTPTLGIIAGVALPAGWYTRIVDLTRVMG